MWLLVVLSMCLRARMQDTSALICLALGEFNGVATRASDAMDIHIHMHVIFCPNLHLCSST